MNILVLMSGGDTGFKDAGYLYPKNFAEIDGKPLFQRVLESLSSLCGDDSRLIVCVRADENRKSHTGASIRLLIPEAVVLDIPPENGGAACTALTAISYINTTEPLVIINGDIILNVDFDEMIGDFVRHDLDVGVAVFESVHPRWSYVKCSPEGRVVEAAEKRPISRLATAGFYYFAKGSDFVSAAMQMIKKDAHVGGLFYICPCLNELILGQAQIGIYRIQRDAYFSLKTPQDVATYDGHLKSQRGHS